MSGAEKSNANITARPTIRRAELMGASIVEQRITRTGESPFGDSVFCYCAGPNAIQLVTAPSGVQTAEYPSASETPAQSGPEQGPSGTPNSASGYPEPKSELGVVTVPARSITGRNLVAPKVRERNSSNCAHICQLRRSRRPHPFGEAAQPKLQWAQLDLNQ